MNGRARVGIVFWGGGVDTQGTLPARTTSYTSGPSP